MVLRTNALIRFMVPTGSTSAGAYTAGGSISRSRRAAKAAYGQNRPITAAAGNIRFSAKQTFFRTVRAAGNSPTADARLICAGYIVFAHLQHALAFGLGIVMTPARLV
jgi:hypothetical protein